MAPEYKCFNIILGCVEHYLMGSFYADSIYDVRNVTTLETQYCHIKKRA